MIAATDWFTSVATSLAVIAVVALATRVGGTRWFPPLPAADPEQAPTLGDRMRYCGAHVLGLLLGIVVGGGLAELTLLPAVERRYSVFDGAGRWIGAFFVALGCAAWFATVLVNRLVRPGALVHLLRNKNVVTAPGLDLRPATKKLGLVVASLAVVLHFGLREMHTTLGPDGVRWREWPWEEEQERPWSALRDVRIVRTLEAPTGRIVERPHLGLEFDDGLVLHVGRSANVRPGFWDAPAAFAAERSGLRVRRVESD